VRLGGGRTLSALNKGRANNDGLLRRLLAILVICSHSYPWLQGNNDREPDMVLAGGRVTGGELAVNGFLILSGFLIAQSWVRSRGAANNFRKRVARIYPGFVVAVLFSGLVAARYLASDRGLFWTEFSATESLLSTLNLEFEVPKPFSGLPVPGVNGSPWWILFEFFCYVGMAAIGVCGVLRRRRLVACAFLASLA
jgi:peptidoglycan/LPS O-acetylase OafA/YrhL